MAYEVKTVESKEQWDSFVTSHPEANFLQSWQWGEFHTSRSKTIVRRGIYDDNKLVAVYTGHVEPARRGIHLEIAGGPIVDWQNQSLVEKVFADIADMAKGLGCVYVRIRSQLLDSPTARHQFGNLGLKKAPMYLSVELAGVIDLTKTDQEILQGMRQRLRRALRKAEKNTITVEKSTDPAAIKEFYKIQLQTAGRHQFVAFSEDFLTKQFAAFAKDNSAVLYTAKYQGEILAQNFMIFYGNGKRIINSRRGVFMKIAANVLGI